MFNVGEKGLLVVELETKIDSSSKLEHCTSQILRYIKLKNQFQNHEVKVALVYAQEGTPERYTEELQRFAADTGILLSTYSLQSIQNTYNKMVNQLNRASGISLGRSLALGITSISWINKFMLPFLFFVKSKDKENMSELLDNLWHGHEGGVNYFVDLPEDGVIDSIPWNTVKQLFSSNTNFYVLKRLVEDFELIEVKTISKTRYIFLTEFGSRFRDELYLRFLGRTNNKLNNQSSIKELTLGQKRLLLEILLNGNFTKLKINIFHFLRYVHLTEGSWLPKARSKVSAAERQYLNNMFNSSYNSRTLKDLILQTCTFCAELGLVNRLSEVEQVY
ncbi:MAG: hypothetical protein KAJ51_01595, partial [Thermoplasmata archaeon]|nr:hypothetical protein [Thermoplasmata archaeon]